MITSRHMVIKTLLMQYLSYAHYLSGLHNIKPASKHCNDVILSDAKNLAFSCCYEILHGACPEHNDKILRCSQNDMRRVQDDNYNCRVNKMKLRAAETTGDHICIPSLEGREV